MKNTFKPPVSAKVMSWLQFPAKVYFSPVYFGLDNINPEKPHLFVGNHTIYGGMDIHFYWVALYKEKGICARGLGDHYHFLVPGWRTLLEKFGGVDGTAQNCADLMKKGENIIVFPGGGREVCRRKGEDHCLIWKERTGFARLAVEYGYPISPIASVGPDYAYSIFIDAKDVMESLPGRLLGRLPAFRRLVRDGEAILPISRGLGLTAIPRPERFYFAFGKPINTTPYHGMHDDPNVINDLRDQTATAINTMFAKLKLYRKNDTGRGLIRRLLTSL